MLWEIGIPQGPVPAGRTQPGNRAVNPVLRKFCTSPSAAPTQQTCTSSMRTAPPPDVCETLCTFPACHLFVWVNNCVLVMSRVSCLTVRSRVAFLLSLIVFPSSRESPVSPCLPFPGLSSAVSGSAFEGCTPWIETQPLSSSLLLTRMFSPWSCSVHAMFFFFAVRWFLF